jgi:hypothetical protein
LRVNKWSLLGPRKLTFYADALTRSKLINMTPDKIRQQRCRARKRATLGDLPENIANRKSAKHAKNNRAPWCSIQEANALKCRAVNLTLAQTAQALGRTIYAVKHRLYSLKQNVIL